MLLLKCELDNNIIPTTRGPTKPAVLDTVGCFTKVSVGNAIIQIELFLIPVAVLVPP